MQFAHNLGAALKLHAQDPIAGSAGTVTSSAIDRLGYESAVLNLSSGATTGGPDSKTLDAKLTECDSSSGTFTDVTGGAVTQITADSTDSAVSVNLRPCKRYLKVVTVIAFTGGSSPKCPAAAVLILGGAAVEPTT